LQAKADYVVDESVAENVAANAGEYVSPDAGEEYADMPSLHSTRLPYGFARRYGVFLAANDEQQLTLYYREGILTEVLGEVRRFSGVPFTCELLATDDFDAAMSKHYESKSGDAMQAAEDLGDDIDLTALANSLPETADLLEQQDDAPVIRLINAILAEAVKQNASDVHIETYEKRLAVRARVDGMLHEILQPRRELAPLLVSRIKVMAKLDIAEKRVPQDGRISLRVGGREVDVRVSTMPSSAGERVVLRLLDKQAGRLQLDSLGMAAQDLQRLGQVLARPHGIVLVTGPTGSGKTTTLYAGLSEINNTTRNILTVEDPIEYNLDGIGQTQVNTKTDMTFARGLRAILRQDPDVVMVGEIRDLETAEIAVQASLTGHLVLSTLHTNSAVGAITRLEDMGIEPFLLSSSLVAVIAQRLVRTLCPDCKESYEADEAEAKMLGLQPGDGATLFRIVGCSACNQQGYRGRIGIYELVLIDDALRRLIHEHRSEADILQQVRKDTSGIREDGFRRVKAGITTLEEVIRVTQED
jgi:general secretion pathway protein E